MKLEEPNIGVAFLSKVEKRKVKREPIINFEAEEETVLTFNIKIDEFGNVVKVDTDRKLCDPKWSILHIYATTPVFQMKFWVLRDIGMGEDVEP
jgi:hypothetical protein